MADEPRPSLHDRIAASRPIFGLLQMYPNPLLAELAGPSGYDFVFLDGEHGVLEEQDFVRSLQILSASQALSWVRLSGHHPQEARKYAQLGADVIVVPDIRTAEQASHFVDALKPHPRTSFIAILESQQGADNARDILKLAGVTGTVIGPNDLTKGLGCPGNYEDPRYAAALGKIETAASEAGKPVGTIPHGSYTLEALHARGHRLLILGVDKWLLRESLTTLMAQAADRVKMPE